MPVFVVYAVTASSFFCIATVETWQRKDMVQQKLLREAKAVTVFSVDTTIRRYEVDGAAFKCAGIATLPIAQPRELIVR